MTDSDKSAAERERRRNLALRALVDEMLGKVRDASRRADTSTWEPGEREHAELVLAEIMARVREEALRRRAGGAGEGGGALDIDVPTRPRGE
jgi:hypothetical protein